MRRPKNSQPSLLEEAEAFLSLVERELAPRLPAYDVHQRLLQVRSEIENEGTYRHTEDELLFGAQVAWRNSNRCLGRLLGGPSRYWTIAQKHRPNLFFVHYANTFDSQRTMVAFDLL